MDCFDSRGLNPGVSQLMPPAFPVETPGSAWLWMVVAIACMHLVCAELWRSQGWVTCVGIAGGLAVILAFSLRAAMRERGAMRFKWSLLSGAVALWIGGFGAIVYGEYALTYYPERAWLHTFLFTCRSLLLLLAVCRTEREVEPRWFAWLDSFQILLIGVSLLFLMFPALSMVAQNTIRPMTWEYAQNLQTVLNAMLVVAAAARLYAVPSARSVTFYLGALGALCTYTVSSPVINEIFIRRWQVPDGSPLFVAGQLPAMAFFLVPMVAGRNWKVKTGPDRELVRLGIKMVSPMFYTLTAILLGAGLETDGIHPVLGVATSVGALLLYGGRATSIYLRGVKTEQRLTEVNQQLEQISNQDALTGTFNRRWFAESLQTEWRRSNRGRQPLTVVLIDVDYFKSFNDRHGHAQGDACLRQVSEALKQALRRQEDSLARYGGEEFVVLLPITDHDGALQVAERLRLAVEGERIAHEGSAHQVVTVSVGTSSYVPGGEIENPEMLLLLADAALYEAKRLGRNRTHQMNESPAGTPFAGRAEAGDAAVVPVGVGVD